MTTERYVENSRTGERVEFVVESPELLQMRVTWSRPGQRAPRHRHPKMEERWSVLDGQAAIEIEGQHHIVYAGNDVVAQPGQAHLAWNPTEQPVQLLIEMRPALRWAAFVRRLFGGTEDPGTLIAEYRYEIEIVT